MQDGDWHLRRSTNEAQESSNRALVEHEMLTSIRNGSYCGEDARSETTNLRHKVSALRRLASQATAGSDFHSNLNRLVEEYERRAGLIERALASGASAIY